MKTAHVASATVALCLLAFGSTPILAGAHTWDVNEVFSNADGTIQFIELREANGTAGEVNLAGRPVTSNTKEFIIPSNVASPSTFKHLLLATQAFADLPGAPTPDHIFPSGSVPFFSVNGDTIAYEPYDFRTFGPGALPTDGVLSWNNDGTTGVNSPTNYAGQTGSVDANPAPAPPGIPDGSAGSTPMDVVALDQSGSSLSISWDTTTCSGAATPHIIYGQGSQFPAAAGGSFGLTGSVCTMGGSPFTWTSTPTATDGTGLIWWLIVAREGAIEGSWGRDSAGAERTGPGPGGASGQCAVTSRSLSNTCGH